MRIALVTDAWLPQINGVVSTYLNISKMLRSLGHRVEVIDPGRDEFITYPCPTYPEIKLVAFPYVHVRKILKKGRFDCVHIATEGPLGWAARRYCLANGLQFTSSYHTRFPEYVKMRFYLSTNITTALLRYFHNASAQTLISTNSLLHELRGRGFTGLKQWNRGVDTNKFHPRFRRRDKSPEPRFLYVGRVAVEKNIEAFLQLDLPGTKVVVGDGPAREDLQERFADVEFPGALRGEQLSEQYASADVFVFPSKTDTYGLVMLEALASGTPVAAYPVTGPVDVVQSDRVGCLDDDLQRACLQALKLSRQDCRRYSLRYSWEMCTQIFVQNLVNNSSSDRLPSATGKAMERSFVNDTNIRPELHSALDIQFLQ